MGFRRRFAPIALVGLFGAGCVGDDQPAAAVDTIAAAAGGTLRLGSTEALTVDPLSVDVSDPISVVVIDAVFDGLTAYDVATRSVVGAVAAEWSTEDGRVWEFRLNPDRTFGDGSTITAEQVVASLERVARSDEQPLASARLEMIEGIRDLQAGAVESATGLVADGRTVRITLVEANQDFPAVLADPTYGIVPAGLGAKEPVVGSGPYGVMSRDAEVLVARRQPGEVATLDAVSVRTFATDDEVAEAFARDEIDVRVERDGAPAGDGTRSVWVSAASLYLGVNTRAPWMDDAAVRRALMSAVDPEAISQLVGSGRSRPAGDLVPGDLFPSRFCGECFAAPENRGDVLGGLGGKEVRLMGLGSGSAGIGAKAVESELVAAGLRVTRPDSSPDGVRAAVLAGEWDLVVFAQVGLVPSVDAFLASSFSSTGAENLTGWSSPTVDATVAAARAEPDAAARGKRFGEAELAVRKAAVARPLVALGSVVELGPRVLGAEPVGGVAFDVRRVALAP